MKSDVESVRSSNCSNGSKGTYDNGECNKKAKSGKSIPCTANHVSIVESDPAVRLLRPSSGPFRTNIFIPGPVVVTKITNPFVNANDKKTEVSSDANFVAEITTVEVLSLHYFCKKFIH
jgi:hypothetical protein